MIRLARFDRLFGVFKRAKKNIGIVNVTRIIYSWLTLNHLFACWFIMLGRSDDFNKTWFARLPAP